MEAMPKIETRERGYTGDIVDITVDNGAIVGCITKSYAGDVVRAVNNHDELVEALNVALFYWKTYIIQSEPGDTEMDDFRQLSRVYAEVKGGE